MGELMSHLVATMPGFFSSENKVVEPADTRNLLEMNIKELIPRIPADTTNPGEIWRCRLVHNISQLVEGKNIRTPVLALKQSKAFINQASCVANNHE